MFVPRYSESEARAAIQASASLAEVLRRLGLCTTGGNRTTLVRWIEHWKIQTGHFDPDQARLRNFRRRATPLAEVLVKDSTYNRHQLKLRLYEDGLKQRICELCGQDELWRGRRLALILDHINGVRDDHQLENLRIVCPNCAATFDTHCGRKNTLSALPQSCLLCGVAFWPRRTEQRYCSRACGQRSPRARGLPQPSRRRVERPAYDKLMQEIADTSWSAVGRRYSVSDNAVRKWVRQYERERAAR